MTTQWFLNSPQLRDFADVEKWAGEVAAIVVKGYTGPDGTLRACVEISGETAAKEVVDNTSAR